MRAKVPFLTKWLSAIALPMVAYGGFNAHPVEALLLGFFLAVASREFAAQALFITIPFSVFLLLRTAQTYSHTANSALPLLACYLGMACIDHRRGRLITPEDGPGGFRAWALPKLRPFLLAGCMLSCAALLFRNVPPMHALAVAGACLLLHRATAPFVDPIAPQKRLRRADLLLLTISVASCLLLVECALRLYGNAPDPPVRVIQPDPKYIFLLEPGAQDTWEFHSSEDESLSYTLSISPQGLRDHTYGPKQANELRILMLGDSHTLGASVELEDSVAKQLERLLQVRYPDVLISIVNAGLMAAGPIQELGMLRERGLALEPDLLILELFPANDIDDSLEWVGKALQAYREKWLESLVGMRRANTFPYRLERWGRVHSRLYQAVNSIVPGQHLAVSFFEGLRFYPRFVAPAPPENSGRIPSIEPDLRDWYPDLAEGFALMKEYVYQIHDECRAHHVDFAAYVMPQLLDLDDAGWQWATGNSEAYERHKALRLTEEFLRGDGFPCCSIFDALNRGRDPQELYYPFDGHCTPLGNRLIAQRLCDYLINEYFPGHTPRVLEGRLTPVPAYANPDALCVPTLENARCAQTRPPTPPR